MGPSSAQSTLTVASSSCRRSRSSSSASGTCSRGSSLRNRAPASVSVSTARRAASVSPSSVRTPAARPPRATIPTTRRPQTTSPPSASRRRTTASREFAGAALGHREADGLGQAAQQPAERPPPGVSGERSACSALPASRRRALARRRAPRPCGGRATGRSARSAAARAREPSPRATRAPARTGGNGVDERVHERRAEAPEARHRRPPGVAVAGRERLQRWPPSRRGRWRRRRSVPSSSGWATATSRAPPAQAVALELEPAQGGGRVAERVEGAEAVRHDARPQDLAGAHGAARLGLRLQHEHRPVVVGQPVGGDEPVVAGADDDRVVRHLSAAARAWRRACGRTGSRRSPPPPAAPPAPSVASADGRRP